MSTKSELIQHLRTKVTNQPVQKILEDLLGVIREGEAGQLLLEALTVFKNGTKIVFEPPSNDLPTGGHFTYKTNVISIADSGDYLDIAHTILFEIYNAHHSEYFRNADIAFKAPGQTPREFGNTMAEIEGKTVEKYIKLIRIIQKNSNQASHLSKLAAHQLTACRDCQTTNDFVLLTKLTSHSSSARDHTAMMSPKVYAYEKVQTMGRMTAANKMKYIIRSKCGIRSTPIRTATPGSLRNTQCSYPNCKSCQRLKKFGYWFSECWSKTSNKKQHPKLWLEVGVQASKMFACDIAPNKLDPMALGFDSTMVNMANRDGIGFIAPRLNF